MSELTFKDIINQVKCEAIPSIIFTEDDLANAKACIQTAADPDILITDPTANILKKLEEDTLSKTGCIPAATEKIKEIIAIETAKVPTSIKALIVKSKVEELIDNLDIIKIYNQERVDFFNSIVDITEPLASQYRYWEDEVDRLQTEIDQITITIASKIPSTEATYLEYSAITKSTGYQKENLDSLIISIIYKIATFSNLYPADIYNYTAINTYRIIKNNTDANINLAISKLDPLNTNSPTLNPFDNTNNMISNAGSNILNFDISANDPNTNSSAYMFTEPYEYVNYFSYALPELNTWITLLKNLAHAYKEKLNFQNEIDILG
jgi:hypothetical protein